MTVEQRMAALQAAKELTLAIVPQAKLSYENEEYNAQVTQAVAKAFVTIYESICASVNDR